MRSDTVVGCGDGNNVKHTLDLLGRGLMLEARCVWHKHSPSYF